MIKDSLDMSNLATYKEISKEELGSTGNIVFNEAQLIDAYNTFHKYLEKNFKLDVNLNAQNTDGFIDGKITINDFRIYNVKDNKITEYDYNLSSGMFIKIVDNAVFDIYTPKNVKVNKTSVYTSISVNMKMIFKYDDENNTKKITIHSYTDAVN